MKQNENNNRDATLGGDEDRSNLYDDVYNQIVMGLGKKGLPGKKTTKKGEVDWSDKEILAKGGDLLGGLTQTKRGAPKAPPPSGCPKTHSVLRAVRRRSKRRPTSRDSWMSLG